MSKKKRITDFTIARLLAVFEQDLYNLFEYTPKKFRFSLEQFLKNTLDNAVRLVMKCLDTPPEEPYLLRLKRDMLIEAHSELRVVEFRLNQLNDLCAMSNETKAKFDIQLFEIYGNLERFANSLNKRLKEESDAAGFDPQRDSEHDRDAGLQWRTSS